MISRIGWRHPSPAEYRRPADRKVLRGVGLLRQEPELVCRGTVDAFPAARRLTSAHDGWSRSTTIGRSPSPAARIVAVVLSSSDVSGPYSCLMISSAWSRAAVSRPTLARYPSPGRSRRPVPRPAHLPAGTIRAERGGDSCPGPRPLIPRWPNQRHRSWHHQGSLVVPLPAHAASLSGRWPLPDAVTWATSWLTLRRDRPNRSAMARWLSGCPAATDAA